MFLISVLCIQVIGLYVILLSCILKPDPSLKNIFGWIKFGSFKLLRVADAKDLLHKAEKKF